MNWLYDEIRAAMARRHSEHETADYWREPLVAVASAQDPLLSRLRTAVDPEHAMPSDLLPGARSVIAYFIPFQKWVGDENDKSGSLAARSWAESYLATNKLIAAINTHLKGCLEQAGHAAATTPATHNFDEEKLISRWSHKHLAYIAGLGTFGHHRLLITSAGCCGRLGSLVTTLDLEPSERLREKLCLLKAGRRCLACVSKCESKALQEHSFDRHECYRQCLRNDRHFSDLSLVDVCGKCACKVPCSYEAPPIHATAALK